MPEDVRVLVERIKTLRTRIESLEEEQRVTRESYTKLLIELKVLQTRVSLYAGLIAVAVSLVSKLVV